MFKKLLDQIGEDNMNDFYGLHPIDIIQVMEVAWTGRRRDNIDVGLPYNRSTVDGLPLEALAVYNRDLVIRNLQGLNNNFVSEHLIYAYLIENTNILEVFRRILFEFIHGEKLGIRRAEIEGFLRISEEIFFSDLTHQSICNLTSRIRPNIENSRKNAYWRMFGMDLNIPNMKNQNGGVDNNDSFHKPLLANTRFVDLFQKFLQEVWVGIANANNQAGVNRTDDSSIANFGLQLHNMFKERRQYGNLAREEFCFVNHLSWFYAAISYNSPIVEALRSESSQPHERLSKMADKVGVSIHSNTYDFYRLAEPLSFILIGIERGLYNDEQAVRTLYLPIINNQQNATASKMRLIINHWSKATGYDLKVRQGLNRAKNIAVPRVAQEFSNGHYQYN